MEIRKNSLRSNKVKVNSEKLLKEVLSSLDDYKKGKYVKGNVNDIIKAIRNYADETDRNRKVHKKSK